MSLTTLIILAIPFALVYLEKKNPFKELFLIPFPKLKPTIYSTLKILGLFLLALIIEGLIFTLLGFKEADKVREVITQQSQLTLILAVTLAPIGEELLFRSYFIKRIGVTLSSLLFAGLHLGYGSVTETVAAFTFAMIAGREFNKNKNIYACILSHAAFNAISLIIFFS